MNYSQDLVALFTQIILLATLSTLVPYVFCSLAGFLSTVGSRDAGRAIGKADGAIAALAFVYAVVAVGRRRERGRLPWIPAADRGTAGLRLGRARRTAPAPEAA